MFRQTCTGTALERGVRCAEYAGITAALTAADKSVKPEKAVHDAITPGEEEKYEFTLVMKKEAGR